MLAMRIRRCEEIHPILRKKTRAHRTPNTIGVRAKALGLMASIQNPYFNRDMDCYGVRELLKVLH